MKVAMKNDVTLSFPYNAITCTPFLLCSLKYCQIVVY